MLHILVCSSGICKEDEQDYLGGNLPELEVKCDIVYEELILIKLYTLIGIDSNHHSPYSKTFI